MSPNPSSVAARRLSFFLLRAACFLNADAICLRQKLPELARCFALNGNMEGRLHNKCHLSLTPPHWYPYRVRWRTACSEPCGAPAGAVLGEVGVVGLQVDAVLGNVADAALKVAAVAAQVIQRRPAVAVYQL